jgi:hypothetical protein
MQQEHRAHARTVTSLRRHPSIRSDQITRTGCAAAAIPVQGNCPSKEAGPVTSLVFMAGAVQTAMKLLRH